MAYPIFSLRFTAFTKGTTLKSVDLCSILANSNSDLVLLSAKSNRLKSLSSTSGKCLPIIREASLLLKPRFHLNKKDKGVTINFHNKYNSTPTNSTKSSNLPVELNHKKYSIPTTTKKKSNPNAKKRSNPLSNILV